MPKVTRRGFIAQTTASVATISMFAAAPALAVESELPAVTTPAMTAPATSAPELSAAAAAITEPLIAHVSNIATGEISVLVGTQEITYRDPELVQRLLRAIP